MFKSWKTKCRELIAELIKEIKGLTVDDYTFSLDKRICSFNCGDISVSKHVKVDGSYEYAIAFPREYSSSWNAPMLDSNMGRECLYSEEAGKAFLKKLEGCSKFDAEVFSLTAKLTNNQKRQKLVKNCNKIVNHSHYPHTFMILSVLNGSTFERCNVASLTPSKTMYSEKDYESALQSMKDYVLKCHTNYMLEQLDT